MKIFLTGATGFIGSHTLELLMEKGCEVVCLCREDSDKWRIEGEARFITGDIRIPESYSSALADFRPDIVMHLAWFGVGNAYRDDPRQAENLPALRYLLENAHRAGARKFIGMGSQAEYGPCHNRINEEQITLPTSLYGVTKLSSSLMSKTLCAAFGIDFAWLRLFSGYGPKDDPAWMIPYLILSLLKAQKPSLTACEQRWDYIHVRDVASALWHVARTHEANGVFNLGSGMAYPLKHTVSLVRDLINASLPVGIGEKAYAANQVMHLEADIGRLQSVTGWNPQVGLEDGIRETVEWYKARHCY